MNANVARDFRWDILKVVNVIKTKKPNVIIICNPNNPTGVYCKRHEIETLVKASIHSGSMVILDEAYLSFVANPWNSLSMLKYSNIMLIRSMTKNYANTALRLGYAVASADIVSKIRALQPDWSVNSLAQKVGIAALEDNEYLSNARKVVFSARNYLENSLNELGLKTIPTDANFLLIKVDNASKWRYLLLKKGVVVRDCSSFGLPKYIRVGIRVIEDCKILVEAITKVSEEPIDDYSE